MARLDHPRSGGEPGPACDADARGRRRVTRCPASPRPRAPLAASLGLGHAMLHLWPLPAGAGRAGRGVSARVGGGLGVPAGQGARLRDPVPAERPRRGAPPGPGRAGLIYPARDSAPACALERRRVQAPPPPHRALPPGARVVQRGTVLAGGGGVPPRAARRSAPGRARPGDARDQRTPLRRPSWGHWAPVQRIALVSLPHDALWVRQGAQTARSRK